MQTSVDIEADDVSATLDADADDDAVTSGAAASYVNLRAGQFCMKILCEFEGVSCAHEISHSHVITPTHSHVITPTHLRTSE